MIFDGADFLVKSGDVIMGDFIGHSCYSGHEIFQPTGRITVAGGGDSRAGNGFLRRQWTEQFSNFRLRHRLLRLQIHFPCTFLGLIK